MKFPARRRTAALAVASALLVALAGLSACTSDRGGSSKEAAAAVAKCQGLLDKQVAHEVATSVQLPGSTDQVVTGAEITDTDPLTCTVTVEIDDYATGMHTSLNATITDRKDAASGTPVTTKVNGSPVQAQATETYPRFDAVSTLVGYEQVAEMFKAETKRYPKTAALLRNAAQGLSADTSYGNGRFFTYTIKKYAPGKKGVSLCVVNDADGSWAYSLADGRLAGMSSALDEDGSGRDEKPCTKNVDLPTAPSSPSPSTDSPDSTASPEEKK